MVEIDWLIDSLCKEFSKVYDSLMIFVRENWVFQERIWVFSNEECAKWADENDWGGYI